ncbi:MAG: deoxyribonuclease IV [Patescibacteria group bacterium]
MNASTPKPRIGGHVSVAGGLKNGILRAKEIGANTIQFFGSSPRSWAVQQHRKNDIEEFKNTAKEYGVFPLFIHANYLVNLASPDELLRKKSELSLRAQLKQANDIGVHGLIFHIGSGKETPKNEALTIVVGAIERIMGSVDGDAFLVIENSAGGGQKIGSSIKEIGTIIQRVGDQRVKMCFDTAHAFEAGIIESYTAKNITALVSDIKKYIGIKKLVALHINDSKSPFNSHYDRHENIGEGYLGLSAFKNLLCEPCLAVPAWILEVPGFDGMGPDKKNIDILKSLISHA